MIRRRAFLAAALAAPWLGAGPLLAQRRWRIAVLDWETNPPPERLGAFRDGLRAEGLVDGEHVAIDYRSAEGDEARARTIAAEFARGGYDVLVGLSTPSAHALRQVEREKPIVFSLGDALSAGIVRNLARPEANLTGVSNIIADLEGKRLALLAEVLPGLRRVAYVASTRDPAAEGFVREAVAAGARLGLAVTPRFVATADRIEAELAAHRNALDAVIVQPIFTLSPTSSAVVANALRRGAIPAIGTYTHFARAGGLVAYGPAAEFGPRRSARFVARILRGARPADLPVEQPTEFLLALNLKTAQELGLTIPPLVLARADEVIE
jgi:putative ABC transport system substrate-binding protein